MIPTANKNLLILLTSVIAFWSWLSLPLAHGANIRADFNGDGFDDLAIGAPGENKGAGGVNVIYGSATGLTTTGDQFFSQASTGVPDSPESGDNCGAALIAGDFNGDGFDDLAVGCPGEDVGSNTDLGAVFILYGSQTGLTGSGSQFFSFSDVSSSDLSFSDKCGTALGAGDFNNDGFTDLAMGCPGREVGVTVEGGGVFDAGRVIILYGSANKLTTTGRQSFTQNTTGIDDVAEGGDNCGAALVAGDFNGDGFDDLAVGCPGEDVGGNTDVGAVNIIYGSATGLTSSDDQFFSFSDISSTDISASDRCATALAAGDFNDDGFTDLAMGCPGRDIGVTIEGGGVRDAGRVIIVYGSATGLTATGRQSFTQDTPDIADAAEAGDNFGAALTAGDFNGDGFSDLVVGTPREDIAVNIGGSVTQRIDHGVIHIIYGSAGGLTSVGNQRFSGGFIDFVPKLFGAAVNAGDFNGDGRADVAVGSPQYLDRAGAVSVLYGSASGITSAGTQFFTQGNGIADSAEDGDLFGFALPGSSGPSGAGLTGTWQELVQTCRGEGTRLSCLLQGTFTVINPGTQGAPSSVLRFFLSADATLDQTDILLSEVAIGVLQAGETKSRQLNVHLAGGSSASGKFVIAFADADNVVAETNEENNIVPFGPID